LLVWRLPRAGSCARGDLRRAKSGAQRGQSESRSPRHRLWNDPACPCTHPTTLRPTHRPSSVFPSPEPAPSAPSAPSRHGGHRRADPRARAARLCGFGESGFIYRPALPPPTPLLPLECRATRTRRLGHSDSDMATRTRRLGHDDSDTATRTRRLGHGDSDTTTRTQRLGHSDSDTATRTQRLGQGASGTATDSDTATRTRRLGPSDSDMAIQTRQLSVKQPPLASPPWLLHAALPPTQRITRALTRLKLGPVAARPQCATATRARNRGLQQYIRCIGRWIRCINIQYIL
jgi:hypothetical protein